MSLETKIERINYVEALIQYRNFLEDLAYKFDDGDDKKFVLDKIAVVSGKIQALKEKA